MWLGEYKWNHYKSLCFFIMWPYWLKGLNPWSWSHDLYKLSTGLHGHHNQVSVISHCFWSREERLTDLLSREFYNFEGIVSLCNHYEHNDYKYAFSLFLATVEEDKKINCVMNFHYMAIQALTKELWISQWET